MKKKVSGQNTDRPAKVHGMYGSMHADFFEETGIAGLRGMDLGFLTGFKNRRKNIRPDGKSRGTAAAAGAIAAERPVYIGGMGGFERLGKFGNFGKFGKGPGSGSLKAKARAASAGVLRSPVGRPVGKTRTRAKEQESMLRALGRSFSIRSFLLLMLAALSITAALVLMLFNFKKAVINGNTKYSQKQIESFITQGRLGENTFVMALKYHNRAVKGIPFIDRIDVDIINPSTVRVNITEKPLDGYIVRGDDKIYFSKGGIVQTISGRTDENVTLVNGIEVVNPETDAYLQAKNQSGMDNVLALLNAMDRYDLKADSIDVDRLGSITVTFGDVRLSVGKTGYDMKMYKVHQIFPFFKGRKGCISMTGSDFRGDNIVLSPLKRKVEKLSKSGDGKKGDGGGNSGKSGGSEDSGTAKGSKKADKDKKKDGKEEASEKEKAEKEKAKKENAGKEKSAIEKSEIEKQEQKAKAAGEKTEADAQKKEAGGETEQKPEENQTAGEAGRKPAEEQTSDNASRNPVENEAVPDREKASAPAAEKSAEQTAASSEEKETAAPAEKTVAKPAGQNADSAGKKIPEKPAEQVKEAEEKPADRASAPATVEVDGQGAMRASQKPMAPVAGNTAD